MPSFLEIQGITALNRIATAIPSTSKLTAKLMEQNSMSNTNISSCNMTASLLFNTINNAPPQPVQGIGTLSQKARADRIASLLNTANVVYVNITPDHHFIVFPISETKVSILQGFQDVYNFRQWYEKSNQGKMDKSAFNTNMRKLVSGDQASRVTAARDLFSYADAEVIGEIAAYFMNPPACQISQIAYKAI